MCLEMYSSCLVHRLKVLSQTVLIGLRFTGDQSTQAGKETDHLDSMGTVLFTTAFFYGRLTVLYVNANADKFSASDSIIFRLSCAVCELFYSFIVTSNVVSEQD